MQPARTHTHNVIGHTTHTHVTGHTTRDNTHTHLVHTDRLAINLDHVHDFYCIVSIIFTHELDKPVTLVLLSDAITWHVYIHCREVPLPPLCQNIWPLTHRTSLQKQFPQEILCHLLIKAPHIHSSICTLRCGCRGGILLFDHYTHLDSAPV